MEAALADDNTSFIAGARKDGDMLLSENAGQVWNHNFNWNCMKPGGGGHPSNPVSDLINSSFGSYEQFRDQFFHTGMATFGSGWVLLVFERSTRQLKVIQTKDGETPVADDEFIPNLVLTMVRTRFLLFTEEYASP
jgi:Fe-Mn family superoxide dismutase